ncbi:PHP domain-containing protein [Phycisphaerales bacterium AB-hyl4]|uniref:PHP domain-containing protein n=1 Tax=Natronomicrosphaera hydrolytica TaxID=3242702 RepID=A0ABV4U3C2_9BACT
MSHVPNRYRYETHMHTSEGSACGKSTGAELARMYAKAGYAGIIITDHFFNGNCAVPRDLPWGERVERFCLGYENAAAAGGELNLSVFLGWEYNYRGTEFLTYGLDKAFLLAHPDILDWDVVTYLDAIREAGGLISQAHPFRQRPYIEHTRLFHNHVDAAEVYNASDCDAWNDMACRYVAMNNLMHTAGSDTHHVSRSPLSGLGFDRPLHTIEEFIAAVRAGDGVVLRDIENPLVPVTAAPSPAADDQAGA